MRILIDNGNTPAAPRPYIGHYGRLRKAYLEQYRPDLYTALVANEKLHEHCAEIDEAARSRIDLNPALRGPPFPATAGSFPAHWIYQCW